MGASSRSRQAEQLAELCLRQGFRVRETRQGFVAYAHEPSGPTVGWHKTSSDHRWYANTIANLRRIGVQI